MLYFGCFLLVTIGLVHSYLGEKYILIRLFRRDNLPKISGSAWYTKRVLRFAWHITTIVWWGVAAILFLLENPSVNIRQEILLTITFTFLLSGIVSAIFSHGKHLSWIVFFAIAGLCGFTAM